MSFLLNKILEKKKIIVAARKKMNKIMIAPIVTFMVISTLFVFFNSSHHHYKNIVNLLVVDFSVIISGVLSYFIINLFCRLIEDIVFKKIANKEKVYEDIKNHGISKVLYSSIFGLKRMKVEEVDLENLEKILKETTLEEGEVAYIKNSCFPKGLNNQKEYIDFLLRLLEQEKLKNKSENYTINMKNLIKKVKEKEKEKVNI